MEKVELEIDCQGQQGRTVVSGLGVVGGEVGGTSSHKSSGACCWI